MLKRIPKTELRLGMYIHSLDQGWLSHPFLRGSFLLRKEADLKRLQGEGEGGVTIDTAKGLDTAEPPVPPARVPYPQELATAREIKREADAIVHSLFMDVRMGRQIQVERLEPVVLRMTDSILRSPGTLVNLCRLRAADRATFQHCVSSCALLIMFGHHLHLDRTTLREAGIGGLLHDIGKMRVPNHILNKPGELNEAESAIMRRHVELGLETLAGTPGVSSLVMAVAAEHHERLDGSGYPRGLRGFHISPMGRMATIVDVYDAMTAQRIYHQGMEPAEALQRLYQGYPGCFDEDLVQHFIQALGIYPVGSLVRLESNRLAVVVGQNRSGMLHPVVRVFHDIASGQDLPPFDLDLSGADDAVRGHENPADWKLDPHAWTAWGAEA